MSEWDELISVLQQPTSPAVMQQAAQKAAAYFATRPHSRVYFCRLADGRSVPLDQIPQKIATDPQFYELFKKIAAKGG